jgi:hypothetical protein
MKSFSFAKALTVGCLLTLSLPIACGDDDDDTTPHNTAGTGGSGGAAGAGGMSEPGGAAAGGADAGLPPGISVSSTTVACGADMCDSASVPKASLFIDPCCAADACGLDTAFLGLVGATFADKCQAKGQVGEPDESCPTTAPSMIPFAAGGNTIMVPIDGFVGCCRENGKCGVIVDEVNSSALGNITTLGLGCVDAAPFFPGETPVSCGASMGGAGAGGGGGAGAGGAAGGMSGASPGGAGGAGGTQ